MLSVLSSLLALGACAVPTPQDAAPFTLTVDRVLAVESVGEPLRAALRRDAMLERLAREPRYAPTEGEVMVSTTGDERIWSAFEAGENGNFNGGPFRGGWAYAEVEVPETGSYRLEVVGATAVRVDGEPRYGDVYSLGLTRLPMHLEAGSHQLLFRCGRGRLTARLEACAPVYLENKDRTLPNVVLGEDEDVLLGVIVGNASDEPFAGGLAAVTVGDQVRVTKLPTIPANSLRKVAIEARVAGARVLEGEDGALEPLGATLTLQRDDRALDSQELQLKVKRPTEQHDRTFRSAIDGSVQYYAANPPRTEPLPSEPFPLILSLHGASVQGRAQARCYDENDWCTVIGPTNRRPFGFDWEDWGRKDALEVLALASERYGADPLRTYLSGHSMGGHGTWSLGSLFPDRFAAIAPSAGWREFWTYGGGGDWSAEDPVGVLFNRAAHASRTLGFVDNLRYSGVYVLHGDADTNVPVREARAMRTWLAENHADFAYYERPGAGHWWGNRCVEWPPLMDFLEHHTTPADGDVRDVEFVTPSPGISAECYWIEVLQQERALDWTRVRARFKPGRGQVVLEAENVRRLALDLTALGTAPESFEGETLAIVDGEDNVLFEQPWGVDTAAQPVVLELRDEGWRRSLRPAAGAKHPARYGPFKEAFDHRMVFVYGTQGSPAENAWSFAKARFDHETWRYRGNGAVDVIADVDFDPAADVDRGVVLYGNRDTNAAFASLCADADFDLTREALRVGDTRRSGDELAFLACTPRPGSDLALVAVVGGTGLVGCHTTDELPYFTSGCHFPDWCVLTPATHLNDVDGVVGAGFFGTDWRADGPGAVGHWRP
ncbi:MAG: carboxylesterase family protein [Planctomycetota bacterium]|jgi:poly(3-hydroxybutyrate) depolymerase